MPWRMLLFLVVLIVVVILFTANMENRVSISFIFTRLDEVPIFMAALVAFIAGALTMLPFTTGRRRKPTAINKKSSEDPSVLRQAGNSPSTTPPIGEPLDTPPSGANVARRQKPRRRRRVKPD